MTDEPTKIHEVELRDLEPLLRKSLADNGLEVLEYRTEPLLQLGENYGSTILKVRAEIRKNDGKEETLEMVAKMLPGSDFQRKIFDSSYTFRKEAFLYEKLIPSYQSLEREFGVEDVFDIVPKLYGVRFSLKGDDEVDDDAVILMENLKVRGYYVAERRIGLNLDHAKATLPKLARFHALGIAMKHHKPENYEIIKHHSKCLKLQSESFTEVVEYYKRIMRDDPEISQHYDKVLAALSVDMEKLWTEAPPEPWSTVVHADFWINNFMFHRDPKSGRIDSMKFVDFQNYLIMSPLRELAFFLMTNLSSEVMEHGFDDLLDLYYESFIEVLKRMKCDTEPFARDKFDERMRIDGFNEFMHCPFMIRVLTAQVDDPDKVSNFISLFLDEKLDPLFVEKLRKCVNKFVEKGWLDRNDENAID